MPELVNVNTRAKLLIDEARVWLGLQEVGGNNRGPFVEMFERAAGIPVGSPWCMAFAQWCVGRVDRIVGTVYAGAPVAGIVKSAHCLSVWSGTNPESRSGTPVVGSLVIWRHVGTSNGHTGIVTGVTASGFTAIEGNTSPTTGVDRDGDGVFEKSHVLKPTGTMELVGFVLPWGKS